MGDNRNDSEDSHIWGFAQDGGRFASGPRAGTAPALRAARSSSSGPRRKPRFSNTRSEAEATWSASSHWRPVASLALQLAVLAALIAAFFVRTAASLRAFDGAAHTLGRVRPDQYHGVPASASRNAATSSPFATRATRARSTSSASIGVPGDRIRIDRGIVYVNGADARRTVRTLRRHRSFARSHRHPAGLGLRSGRQPRGKRRFAFLRTGERPLLVGQAAGRHLAAANARRESRSYVGTSRCAVVSGPYGRRRCGAFASTSSSIDIVIEVIDARVARAVAILCSTSSARVARAWWRSTVEDLADPRHDKTMAPLFHRAIRMPLRSTGARRPASDASQPRSRRPLRQAPRHVARDRRRRTELRKILNHQRLAAHDRRQKRKTAPASRGNCSGSGLRRASN